MQNETRDLAALSGAALLDHYLESVQNQLSAVLTGSTPLDTYSKSTLAIDMKNLRSIIGYTSSNPITSRYLVKWVNNLIKQLHRQKEYRPYTLTCIQKTQQAINHAIQGHFSNKEKITDTALLSVLQNVRVLREKNIVPNKMRKLLQGDDDDD